MEKVMESYGISKGKKSVNPVQVIFLKLKKKKYFKKSLPDFVVKLFFFFSFLFFCGDVICSVLFQGNSKRV